MREERKTKNEKRRGMRDELQGGEMMLLRFGLSERCFILWGDRQRREALTP